MRSASIQGFDANHSAALIVSSYGFVMPSGLIESVNAWPKPLEPWKLCQAVT